MRTNKIYVMALAWVIGMCTACTTDVETHEANELGYIFFHADVNSRVTLTMGNTVSQFGVLGYKYGNYWESEATTALPNVFTDDSKGYNQPVTLTGSLYQYTPVKTWEPGFHYSFFGYHPYSTSFPESGNVTLSDKDYTGIPYINYTVESWTEQTGMTDIMTACSIDDPKPNSDEVNLTFKHRLYALEVKARNFNDNTEYIRNVSITITNLKYKSVQIFLDGNVSLPAPSTYAGTYALTTTGNAITLPAYNVDDSTTGQPISATDDDKRLLLIPQEGGITGYITFDWYDGSKWTKKEQSFEIVRTMEEGHFYNFIIDFADDVISITFVDSDQWDEKTVEVEFE